MKLKSIKQSKSIKNSASIQICPQCGSPDIETDFSNPGAINWGFLSSKKCNNCGHVGTFFPSISKNKVKAKPSSKVKGQDYVDKTFSKGYFAYTFLIWGIIFLLLELTMITFYKTHSPSFILSTVGILLILMYYLSKRFKK
jgi:hypothetical protein